jgi:hypothetical protein
MHLATGEGIFEGEYSSLVHHLPTNPRELDASTKKPAKKLSNRTVEHPYKETTFYWINAA